MNKKELGERIKLARFLYSKKTDVKLTQQLLAEKIGISRSYMGDIESGRTYPTFVVLSAIADACDLPLNFFSEDEAAAKNVLHSDLYDDGLYSNSCENSLFKLGVKSLSTVNSMGSSFRSFTITEMDNKYASIPVLGVITAGSPVIACENIIGYEYIPDAMAKGGSFFGLKVSGDSMNNSRIFDGDIVLVRRQCNVENGEIAVVMIDEEGATIKRYFRTDSIITLMPDSSNKDHHPRFIDIARTHVTILGKVVKVIINME